MANRVFLMLRVVIVMIGRWEMKNEQVAIVCTTDHGAMYCVVWDIDSDTGTDAEEAFNDFSAQGLKHSYNSVRCKVYTHGSTGSCDSTVSKGVIPLDTHDGLKDTCLDLRTNMFDGTQNVNNSAGLKVIIKSFSGDLKMSDVHRLRLSDGLLNNCNNDTGITEENSVPVRDTFYFKHDMDNKTIDINPYIIDDPYLEYGTVTGERATVNRYNNRIARTNRRYFKYKIINAYAFTTFKTLATILTLFSFILTPLWKPCQDTPLLIHKTEKFSWKNEHINFPNFLFRLRPFGNKEIQLYPSSYGTYVNDIIRNTSKKDDLMRYEWARFRSFQNFPKDATVSAMRLSQNGFYYTGQDQMSSCFSCGVLNGIWLEGKTVEEIHKRISPGCDFVNGKDRRNVPIYLESDMQQHNITQEHELAGAACGGQEDLPYRQDNVPDSIRPSPISECLDVPYKESEKVNNRYTYSVQETAYDTDNEVQEQKHEKREESGRRTEITRTPTDQREHLSNIGRSGQPKYFEYAQQSVRLSSFAHWPIPQKVEPVSLAEAGLFYAGQQDYVRCFLCGGGMKNWEHGDNPWIEHARWFPKCDYVIQVKGESFINMCVMASSFEQNIAEPTTSSSHHSVSHINQDVTEQLHEFHISDETIEDQTTDPGISEDLIEDATSPRAKFLLEMGYAPTVINDSITKLREERTSNGFSVHTILEHILEHDVCTHDETATGRTDTRPTEKTYERRVHSPIEQTEQSYDCKISANKKSTSEQSEFDESDQKKLQDENEKLKQMMLCKICMDTNANVVFLPCGHMVACVACAHALKKCAICRKYIKGSKKAFPS